MATPDELFALTTSNRLLAVDLFAGLDDDQWTTPSLCAGWTVREVAAHLIPPEGGISWWALARDLLRYRGDLDAMVDVMTRDLARRPTTELVAMLRARAGDRSDPPVIGPIGPMVDSAIHLRDAARPLGSAIGPEPTGWRPVLDFLVSRPATRGFVPKGRLDGLRLVAADLDWAWGEGIEVLGEAEALAMAVSGRAVATSELEGPGSAIIAERVAP